jgi:hypothetical protein
MQNNTTTTVSEKKGPFFCQNIPDSEVESKLILTAAVFGGRQLES